MCFVYHISGFIIIKHQVDINATENVKYQITFDREAKSKLVAIKGYQLITGY